MKSLLGILLLNTLLLSCQPSGGPTSSSAEDVAVSDLRKTPFPNKSNSAPVVRAGADRSLVDQDNNGQEVLLIQASAQDAENNILTYRVYKNGILHATSTSVSIFTQSLTLPVGTHTLNFQAEDAKGLIGQDSVQVLVSRPVVIAPINTAPVVNAGADIIRTDSDNRGSVSVTLAASASDAQNNIVLYSVSRNGTFLASGASTSVFTISHNLSVGTHTFVLEATDADGLKGSDSVVVTINPGVVTLTPVLGPNLLVNASFENGLESWNAAGIEGYVPFAQHGNYAARWGLNSGYFYQAVPVIAGKTYRLTSWHKREPGNQGAQFYYSLRLPDGTEKGSGVGYFATDWQRLTFDVEIPAGVSTMNVHFYGHDGGYIYADNVSMNEIVTPVAKPTLVAEGDSITVSGHSWFYHSNTSDLRYFNHAVGGSSLESITARQQAILDRRPASGPWVVSVLIAANDLHAYDPVVYANNLFAYCDRLRAAGAKVAVGTALPQAFILNFDNFNHKRVILNQLIRSNVGVRLDAVIDYAADPVIGTEAAAADPSLYPDGLHPSFFAQYKMFLVYKPVINRLLDKAP